jgi:hypothetical protein
MTLPTILSSRPESARKTAGPLLLALAAAIATPGMEQAQGPVSELYLNASNNVAIWVVRGSSIVRSWPRHGPSAASAIAVEETVRTASVYGGVEYTLDGTPTGLVFPGWTFPPDVYDGTSDGTYNYSWDFVYGAAYRHDRDWRNPVRLFTLGTASGRRLGITLDSSDGTLWVSGWDGAVGNWVENYTLKGRLIRRFAVGVSEIAALAMDPADRSLWFGTQEDLGDGMRTLYQYSRDGMLIGSVTIAELSDQNYLGSEFQLLNAPVDLDIAKFRVDDALSKRTCSEGLVQKLIAVGIRNAGGRNRLRAARVVGVQADSASGAGEQVYNETIDLSAPVGSPGAVWSFPSYQPTRAEAITWTLTVDDDDADADERVVTTPVVECGTVAPSR